jgi:hypothetical protein
VGNFLLAERTLLHGVNHIYVNSFLVIRSLWFLLHGSLMLTGWVSRKKRVRKESEREAVLTDHTAHFIQGTIILVTVHRVIKVKGEVVAVL